MDIYTASCEAKDPSLRGRSLRYVDTLSVEHPPYLAD